MNSSGRTVYITLYIAVYMMSEGPRVTIVIFDNGSLNSRIGVAGEENPRYLFPTIVGTAKKGPLSATRERSQRYFIGDEAYSKRGTLDITYPIKDRVIMNWEDMEQIWSHSYYNVLKIDPTTHPLLVTEPVLNPKKNRERITQIMFETFKVTDLYIAHEASLAIYAARVNTGIVFNSGDSITTCSPVYDGFYIPKYIVKANSAGSTVTNYLLKLLRNRGYSLESKADLEWVRELKEQACYVAADFQTATTSFDEEKDSKVFKSPNGDEIRLGKEMFQCPEALFQADITRVDTESLPAMLHKSIMKCDKNMRDDMYKNIVLCGGNTMFPGFPKRFEEEVKQLTFAPNTKKALSRRMRLFKVVAPENRNETVFKGASIFSSLKLFEDKCISRDEYDEHGPTLVHKKCV